jgi:hypothetical protein
MNLNNKELKKNRLKVKAKNTSDPGSYNMGKVNPLIYSIIITLVFFLIALTGILHHEMWRDEHQSWLVARDAHSVPELFKNMRYEGNPALWQLLLYFITIFTHNPVYMQYLHLLIACGFIFVFNRYSATDIPFKILFSFGYFTLYEYTVISRSYGLAVLFIFIICALYKDRYKYYILIFVFLGFLANVTIYGLIIALGMAVILVLDYILYQKRNKNVSINILTGIILFISGAIFSVYQIMPDENNSFPALYAKGFTEMIRWGSIFSRLFVTFFYIPESSGIHFWNTNIYFKDHPEVNSALWDWLNNNKEYMWGWVYMPVILFFTSIIIFLPKPLILLLYTGVTTTLLSVYYYTDLLHMRYCGFLLIILIVCYWLAKYYPDKIYKSPLLKFFSLIGRKVQRPFIFIILAANIAGAVIAYSKDYRYIFSPGKDAAAYIKENKLDTLTVVGLVDFAISPIASYSDIKIFYPQMSDYGSFCIWNKQRQNKLNLQQIFDSVIKLMNGGKDRLLLIETIDHRISFDGGKNIVNLERGMISKNIKLELIKRFEPGIIEDEKYNIFMVQRTDSKKENLSKYPLLKF